MLLSARELSPYDNVLLQDVLKYGGFYNAHAHLDRADTLGDEYLRHINTTPLEASSLPLSVKQNLTGDLHRGLAYAKENLQSRMSAVLERLISYGTTKVDTCIDATTGVGKDGLLAISVAQELKEKFADRIKLRFAPNPIFGFKEGSGRWEIFCEAAKVADFLSGLPEKDGTPKVPPSDGRIGFECHLRRVIELGWELKKEVHFHLDQANNPEEQGTETLIEALRYLGCPQIPNHTGPTVWVIHAISPSAYSEGRFARLVDGLLEFNVGIIVCPTAAISMRQLRPIASPTHNCIARILELVKRKVPVLLGSDNIADMYVPQSDGDMLTEIKLASHAVRFAIPYVWAKLGSGVALNNVDRATVGRFLYQDRISFQELNNGWKSAVE